MFSEMMDALRKPRGGTTTSPAVESWITLEFQPHIFTIESARQTDEESFVVQQYFIGQAKGSVK